MLLTTGFSMSAIDLKLKELKEQEEKLKREQKKIDFLNHINASVVSYTDKEFADVKEEICVLVNTFVDNAVKAIESGKVILYMTPTNIDSPNLSTKGAEVSSVDDSKPAESVKSKSLSEMSPNEKMNFALENRHLAGKRVKVANDKNIDINGEVVGLDAPYVFVKTDTGPTIKVPLPNVSLS